MADNQAVLAMENLTLARLACDPSLGSRRILAPGGTVLQRPGDRAENVHFIRSGEVRVYQLAGDGSQRLLEILGPGDWFGAEAVGRLEQYGSQARTMTNSTLYVITAERLLTALSIHPEMSLELIRQLAGRLSTATEEAGGFTFDDCRRRLLKTLLKFSRSAAATITGETVVLRITHEQLAQAVGAARETISLALTDLRHENLLSTGRNRLAFNPRALNKALNYEV